MASRQDAWPSLFSRIHQPRALEATSGTAIRRCGAALARRLEEGKFNADLAQLSEKEVALLHALALVNQSEFSPAPFAHKYPHQYFKRLVQAGLLIRTELLVDVRGFEPLTPCLQSRCSPS